MGIGTRTYSKRFIVCLTIIAAAAVTLSLLASYYTRPQVLRFDENYYYPQAESIAAGDWKEGYIVRAPIYPLFLAGIFTLFGAGFWPALVVQSIVRGVTVGGVGLLGRRYVTERAGLIAGLLVAVYPGMILTYARFMTEVVYIPIFLLSYYLLERVLDSGRIRDAAWAGALSGAASLTRSISFLFTLITAVWLLVRRFPASKSFRGRILLAAVLTAGLFVVLSPWAIRNTITHGAPILVSNDTAFNLWLVISGRQIKDVTPEWRTWGTQAERQAEAYRRWSAKLREDPTFHFRRLGETLPRVFDGNWIMPAGALSMIRRGYGNRDLPTLGAFLRVFAPALFFLVSVGGIIGIAVVERDATRRNLVLIALVYFVLVHAATLFRPRFLLPVQMLLAIYAAGLIDRGLSRLGWTMPDRRRGS